MKRKFLEDLGLEKEVIDKILDQNSQEIGEQVKKVEELTHSKTQLEADIKTRDGQLEALGKATGDADALQKEIKKLQEDNDRIKHENEEKISNMKLDSAIKSALSTSKHADLVETRIVREKLKINEDGSITGLSEQIDKLKKEYSDLFVPEKAGKTPDNKGKAPGEVSAEAFAKMNYRERVNLYKENKELYDQLQGGNE